MPHVEGEEPVKELPIKGKTLAELAKELKVAKAKKKKLDEQSKQQGHLLSRLATGPLAKLMEDRGEDFTNVPGVGALEYGIEVYPSVLKADTEAFHAWLKKNGEGDLIVASVNYKTLQAWTIRKLENAEKLPPMLKATKVPTVSIKKEKKSQKLKK